MTLTAILVTTPDQVERLRQMRNRCAEGFANFTGQVTEQEQLRWWATHLLTVQAWLYSAGVQDAGFGLLTTHEDGRVFTTVGVLPEHTGHDFGKVITADLITKAPGRVYGCARRDNPAAVKLHIPEDWLEIPGDDPRLIYFRTIKSDPWPGEDSLAEWAREGWVFA